MDTKSISSILDMFRNLGSTTATALGASLYSEFTKENNGATCSWANKDVIQLKEKKTIVLVSCDYEAIVLNKKLNTDNVAFVSINNIDKFLGCNNPIIVDIDTLQFLLHNATVEISELNMINSDLKKENDELKYKLYNIKNILQ